MLVGGVLLRCYVKERGLGGGVWGREGWEWGAGHFWSEGELKGWIGSWARDF